MSLSLRGERKGPKERHQRAGRPLDTRLGFMGLFDRGYTRRRFEKRSAKTSGDAFLTPRQTQPRVGAFGVYFSHSFCRVEGGACYPLPVGRQPPLPCLRARSGGEPLGETIRFSTELGSQPTVFLYPTSKTATLGGSKAASSARTALRRPCGLAGLGDLARNRTLSPLCGRKSRADQVVGFSREAPWVTPLSGALLVLFSRQGEKST